MAENFKGEKGGKKGKERKFKHSNNARKTQINQQLSKKCSLDPRFFPPLLTKSTQESPVQVLLVVICVSTHIPSSGSLTDPSGGNHLSNSSSFFLFFLFRTTHTVGRQMRFHSRIFFYIIDVISTLAEVRDKPKKKKDGEGRGASSHSSKGKLTLEIADPIEASLARAEK